MLSINEMNIHEKEPSTQKFCKNSSFLVQARVCFLIIGSLVKYCALTTIGQYYSAVSERHLIVHFG